MFFLKGSWSKEMTTPRNETPNSSFFLLNVRVQASRGLSLWCALLMPNTIWRVTTRLWLIWLVEAIFRRGTNQRVLLRSTKENAFYSSRRGYQCRSPATEHVEALSARFFTFLSFSSPFWISRYEVIRTHAFIVTWSIASPKQSVTRIKPAPEVMRGCWKLVRYQKKI